MGFDEALRQQIREMNARHEKDERLRQATSRLFMACGGIMANAGLITQAAIDKCKSVFIRFLFWAAMQGLI